MTSRIKTLSTNLSAVFQKLPVAAAYLYGSQASGANDALSDYDFGVLFTHSLSPKRRFSLRMRLYEDIAESLKTNEDNLDVVDLFEVPLLLQFNSICGLCIYCKDEALRVEFEAYVMSRYHDEHYYYDRDLQNTITKINEGVYFDRRISYP